MENIEMMNIPKEKFAPAKNRDNLHDKKLDTKPVGYFKDAWLRFRKNKGSVFAFGIIVLLLLFAIIVPMISPYTVAYEDDNFKYNYPKNKLCVSMGLDFWDGCSKKTLNETTFLQHYAIGEETGKLVVKNNDYDVEATTTGNYYTYRLDSYSLVGCTLQKLTLAEFQALQAYQEEIGVQIIYPAVNKKEAVYQKYSSQFANNDNVWYKLTEGYAINADGTVNKRKKMAVPEVVRDTNKQIVLDANGKIQYTPNYIEATGTDAYTSTMYIEGDTKQYDYAVKKQGDQYEVRVDYYEYYKYLHQEIYKDGIKEPVFLFGTTQNGKDILTCLGSGARLSFILAITVSAVNMFVGAIYGAIEGYYGGKLDLFMERFSDILSAVPFMIVISLLKMHMGGTSQLLILFIAFFLTGWIGMASRVRMQFYRFKNQEYVLAARTLGASDRRIMFKHIFPNSLGTIVTGSVLAIPGMIFSESSLSYLGIINLQTGSMTSVGNMLSSAQKYLTSYPYMMLFPALFICLLMLSFNLFGNGLRDAFNPSLRGAED